MGFLDFIFGKKKKINSSAPQPQQAAKPQSTTSNTAPSTSYAPKAELSIAPFVFESNQHQRYENGNPVKGLQECPRTVKVEKNINGCSGYQLKSGDGYIVRMINGDTGQPQMSAKPMRIIKSTATEVVLRGYMVSAQTPFGFQDIDMADYGLSVSLKDGKVVKCVLHMYDRHVDIEYKKKSLKQQQTQQIATGRNYHSSSQVSKPTTCNSSSLQTLVNKCLELESKGKIQDLQNCLCSLYENFNHPGGGKLITNYKEKENLALCFAFLLKYDWMHDSDLREVFSENGFYCIVDHIMHQSGGRQGQSESMLILFTLLCAGRESLKPKIQDIINKAHRLGNPIFHQDDYRIGTSNILDQITLMALSGARDLGPASAPIMSKICEKYDGYDLFQNTVKRTDLMKYDPSDIFMKMKFVHDVIESILNEI